MHVPIPAFPVRISSALKEQWTSSSPCRHESKHDERVPEGMVILESAGRRRARLGQAKNLDKHDGVKDEETCPEEEQLPNSRETRTELSAVFWRKGLTQRS